MLLVLVGYLWAVVRTLMRPLYHDTSFWREFGRLVVLPVWLVWVVGRAVWEALREVVRTAGR